jgi:hypothetical protein
MERQMKMQKENAPDPGPTPNGGKKLGEMDESLKEELELLV